MLKNGTCRYIIFFFIFTQSLLNPPFCVVFVWNPSMFLFFHDSICTHPTFSSSTNNFAHAQTLSRMSSLSGRMNIARVNIEFFPGWKKIKQWCISFVLGYLRTILWKISTAISIKHRILSNFSINKKFNSDSLYAFKKNVKTLYNSFFSLLCLFCLFFFFKLAKLTVYQIFWERKNRNKEKPILWDNF